VLPLISISCKKNWKKCRQKDNITIISTFRGLTAGIATMEMLTALWDMKGVAGGNYTISACAMAVLSKTTIADNTFVHGRVQTNKIQSEMG
jgi:hypothetical protein